MQHGNIIDHPPHFIRIQPVIVTPDMPVFIDDHKLFRVDEIIRPAIPLYGVHKELIPGKIIDLFLGAGEQPPVLRVDIMFIRVLLQSLNGIPFRINTEGKYLDNGIILGIPESFLHHFHMGGKGGTDRRAAGEEEVHHQYPVPHIGGFYFFAELISECKILYLMIHRIKSHLPVPDHRVHFLRDEIRRNMHNIFPVMVNDQVPCQRHQYGQRNS